MITNAVFGNNIENVRKHRDIKLVTPEARRNYLVLKPNYHIKKYVSDNLLAIQMKRIRIIINKPVYLGLSITETSKTIMHQFWCDNVKPEYRKEANYVTRTFT